MVCSILNITIFGAGDDQGPIDKDGIGEVKSCGHAFSIFEVHEAHFRGNSPIFTATKK